MRVDRQWMIQAFDYYNTKYFGGQLARPNLIAAQDCRDGNGSECWGHFDFAANMDRRTRKLYNIQGGTLYLWTKYDRKEISFITTLLHEMIHDYIYTIEQIYPKQEHGPEFMALANKINASEGTNISATNEFETTDTLNGNQDSDESKRKITPALMCVIHTNFDPCKTIICRADFKTLKQFITQAKQLRAFKDIAIYYCYSNKLKSLQSSPKFGFYGKDDREVINKMATYYSESPQDFNFNNLKKYM